ncbi:sigma-70 family RNA polymerase sigma factor [Promicromonospora sp. NFX87]|uniref:sigma-70 family RNA polymerase sigma factor n=1 Tax=Promicromonospora sp. NFX87 TaxID=3402691 RepID=UPI003AFB3718
MSVTEVIAQRSRRAGGRLYVFALPIAVIPDVIPIPDVATRSEGNRLVDPNHAREFGRYWKENQKWAAPPLLLDTSAEFEPWFELKFPAGALEAGVLRLPRPDVTGLQILDGQHRVLGWTLLLRDLADRSKVVAERYQAASTRGDLDAASTAMDAMRSLELLRTRLRDEQVTVEVLDSTGLEDHKQWFFDIARNAKGITRSVTAAFDRSDVVHRAALRLVDEHSSLAGLVEREADRVTPGSNAILSVAQVVAIVRGALGLETASEVGDRHDEDLILAVATDFFDLLFAAFDDLQDVAEGAMTAADLRVVSVAGSVTFLKAVAELFASRVRCASDSGPVVDDNALERLETFLSSVGRRMRGPVPDQLWGSGAWESRDARSPRARRQDIHAITEALAEWWDASGAGPSDEPRKPARSTSERSTTDIGTRVVDALFELPRSDAGSPPTTGPAARTKHRSNAAWPGGLLPAISKAAFDDGGPGDGEPPSRIMSAGATADPVKDYLRQIGKVALLSALEEVEIAKRIEAGLFAESRLVHEFAHRDLSMAKPDERRRRRDLQSVARDGEWAKDRLIRANLRLVVSIAKRYTGRGTLFLDIIQDGNIGLIRAVEGFDYTKGNKFSTFATWWIRQSITRGLADRGRAIRLPVHVVESMDRIAKVERELQDARGRVPSSRTVAARLDISTDEVERLRGYRQPVLSLSTPVPSGRRVLGESVDLIEIGALLVEEEAVGVDEIVSVKLMRNQIAYVLDTLTEREARIIAMRFGLSGGHPMTLEEIGAAMGVTRERIRQIEKKTIEELRQPAQSLRLQDYLDGRYNDEPARPRFHEAPCTPALGTEGSRETTVEEIQDAMWGEVA